MPSPQLGVQRHHASRTLMISKVDLLASIAGMHTGMHVRFNDLARGDSLYVEYACFVGVASTFTVPVDL